MNNLDKLENLRRRHEGLSAHHRTLCAEEAALYADYSVKRGDPKARAEWEEARAQRRFYYEECEAVFAAILALEKRMGLA